MAKRRFVICAAVTALLLGVILGIGCAGGGNSLYPRAIGRIKALNDALLTYCRDYDDVAPGPTWMDGITPYLTDATAFRSPAVENVGYGFALNSAVAGQPINGLAAPESLLTVFDSTDLSYNAVAPTSTLPSPPRYGPSNAKAYLDGHVDDEQHSDPPPPSLYEQSRTRLQSVNFALLIYANDNDNFAPLADQWMDQLTPYVDHQWRFRSPAVQLEDPDAYGYAMNSGIAGAYLPGLLNPVEMISFFDSTNTQRNATTTTGTLPAPPRYDGKNTIAYADGHVAP